MSAFNPKRLFGPMQVPANVIAAPAGVANPTATGAGTTVTAGTKYFVLTYVNMIGETVASTQVSVVAANANTLTVTSPAWPATNPAITSCSVYEGTNTGGPYYKQGSINTSAGTLSVTTEPNTANAQPPAVNTACQDLLLGTVGTAANPSGFTGTAWAANWVEVMIKSIILGNESTTTNAQLSVSIGHVAVGNLIVPKYVVKPTGLPGNNPLQVIPFVDLELQAGESIYAIQHVPSALMTLTVEGQARY